MKTTFKQFLQEATMHKAKSQKDLMNSIKDGKFTFDASELIFDNFYCNDIQLTSLIGAPKTVNRNYKCYNNELTTLEGAPSRVYNFECENNQLTSLEGGPTDIGNVFSCGNNQLTSLEGAPASVGGGFDCRDNQLTSLEGAPTFIGGGFDCRDNQLTSLKDIHKHNMEIKGYGYFTDNPIESHVLGLLKIKSLAFVYLNNKAVARIVNKYLPEGDIFACQQELIDAGFEEYAQL